VFTSTDVDTTTVETIAAVFAALADPIRLRLLRCLEDGERCVCQLQEAVKVAPNLLSYHLRVLREAGLVAARRRGRWVDYRLCGKSLEAARESVPRPAVGV
jgi:ArsR family transcriptional regulator